MPHNSACRLRIVKRIEQDEGREELRREQQRQGRRPERACARSIEEDPALKRAEEEQQRKLPEIKTDDGARWSEANGEVKRRTQDEKSEQDAGQSSGDAKGRKRKAEEEGEPEAARIEDATIVSWVVSAPRNEWTTRANYYIGGEEDVDAHLKSCEQELAEAWGDNDCQELDPERERTGLVQKDESIRTTTNQSELDSSQHS